MEETSKTNADSDTSHDSLNITPKSIPKNSKKQFQKFKGYQIDSSRIYFLGVKDSMSLTGSFSIVLIEGRAFIDGISLPQNTTFTFDVEKSKSLTIFPDNNILTDSEISKIKTFLKIDDKNISLISAVFIVTKNDTHFSRLSSALNLIRKSNSGFKCFKIPIDSCIYQEWVQICKDISKSSFTKIFVCGPKRVGKNSFVRLLSNISVCSGRQVFILDTDVRESMFNYPLQISLSEIKELMHGPGCSKQFPAIYSVYIGDYTPTFQILRYINGIRFLLAIFEELKSKMSNTILIINSIGWLKDFGAGILTDMLRYSKPDVIVNINKFEHDFFYNESSNQGINSSMENFKNFNSDSKFSEIIAQDVIKKIFKFSNVSHAQININNGGKFLNRKNENFKLINIKPCLITSDEDCIKNFESTASIDMSFLHNFYRCQSLLFEEMETNFIQTLIPIKFKISNLVFSFFGRAVDHEYFVDIFRTNIVGFLTDHIFDTKTAEILRNSDGLEIKILDHSEYSECLGVGFIRNIDWRAGDIYIVTPLGEDEIQKMNILAIGNVQLPSRFIKCKNNFSLINPDFCN